MFSRACLIPSSTGWYSQRMTLVSSFVDVALDRTSSILNPGLRAVAAIDPWTAGFRFELEAISTPLTLVRLTDSESN